MIYIKIDIGIQEELFSKLQVALDDAKCKSFLEGLMPFEVTFHGSRPLFPSMEAVGYLRSIGVEIDKFGASNIYRVYIGREISEIKEHYGGVEIPASVLNDPHEFREQVLERIRRVVGRSEDN